MSKKVFKCELTDFVMDLAELVVRDGEGMTRFVTITVKASSIEIRTVVFVKMITKFNFDQIHAALIYKVMSDSA